MATLQSGGQGPMPPSGGGSGFAPSSSTSSAATKLNIAGMAMQGISALFDLYSGITGHKAASKAAREEARAEGRLTSAKLAQLIREERILRGQTIAGTAASGVKTGTGRYGGAKSSPMQILDEQRQRFAEERKIVAEVGATKASGALQRGEMVGRQVMGQAISSASSRAGNVFSLWADYKRSA